MKGEVQMPTDQSDYEFIKDKIHVMKGIKPKKGYIINIAKDYALGFVSNRDPSTKSRVSFPTYLLNK